MITGCIVLKILFKQVGERLWRTLNRITASCLERPRSRESQPRSPSKVEDLTFKSEKVINRPALFCSFWSLPGTDPHLCYPIYSAAIIKIWLDESFIDHNKSLTGNQISDTFDRPADTFLTVLSIWESHDKLSSKSYPRAI